MKLSGIRVLDLSQFLPGPTVTQMMADHGADVIKVENVDGGEPNRHIGQRRNGETVYFACTHRGKQSLALNLKAPEGRDIFLRLAAGADVIIESFRPGVVKRLGIDYDSVRAVNPRIVYASISAYGQNGPLEQDPAHDMAVEAMCGLLSLNASESGEPCIPAMPTGDMLASTLCLSGILMALLRRDRSGTGDYVDISMMDSILSCMPNSVGAVFAEDRAPVPHEERIWGGAALYRIYRTADDRHVVLGGSEIKFAKNLLDALGRPDLLPLCKLPPGAGQRPVVEFLDATFRTRTQAEWVTFFEGVDICFAPVNDLKQGFALEQTKVRGMLLVDESGKKHIGVPIQFAAEPAQPNFHAPRHGEHTRALLESIGLDATQIAQLEASGVVRADATGG